MSTDLTPVEGGDAFSRLRGQLFELAERAKDRAHLVNANIADGMEDPDTRISLASVADQLQRDGRAIARHLNDLDRNVNECHELTHSRYGNVDLYKPCRQPPGHAGEHSTAPAHGVADIAADRARRLADHADELAISLDIAANSANTRNPSRPGTHEVRHELRTSVASLDKVTAEASQVRSFLNDFDRQLAVTERSLAPQTPEPPHAGLELGR